MKISELISEKEADLRIGQDVEVSAICCDTRKVSRGCLFVCIRGTRVDSHTLWRTAVENGAAALLVERVLTEAAVPQIVAKDTRAAMSLAAARWFGEPARKLRLISVVGTNGKTTTAFLIDHLLRSKGEKTCLIGTNGARIGSEELPSALTTPDPIELQGLLAKAVRAGCTTAIMEVSAHAIALRKMYGTVSDIAVFTNLSQDHLDFFGDMATYARTKASFFTPQYARHAVVNVDDETGEAIARLCELPVTTYGVSEPADVFSLHYTPSEQGSVFVVNLEDEICDVASHLHGRYNMYNTLAALSCGSLCGMTLKQMGKALLALPQVPGRFETFDCNGVTVIVDYAHTPDGVENVLRSIREWATGRVLTVIGCGGDRDKEKRPVMARITEAYSDVVVLTSDNPRWEEPEEILAQMRTGLTRPELAVALTDRAQAIRHAVSLAREEDVVAVLGKGSECYIESKGRRLPYCDLDVVREIGTEYGCKHFSQNRHNLTNGA